MKKILIALDGSDHSMRAVKMGCEIAQKFDAKVFLLRVLREPDLPKSLRKFAESEHIKGGPEAVLHRAAQYVLSQAEEIANDKGVKEVESEVLVGPPARTISKYSKNHHIDLIVMGRRGLSASSLKMSDIGDLLMGGVSRRVSNLAECGCLTVA